MNFQLIEFKDVVNYPDTSLFVINLTNPNLCFIGQVSEYFEEENGTYGITLTSHKYPDIRPMQLRINNKQMDDYKGSIFFVKYQKQISDLKNE